MRIEFEDRSEPSPIVRLTNNQKANSSINIEILLNITDNQKVNPSINIGILHNISNGQKCINTITTEESK